MPLDEYPVRWCFAEGDAHDAIHDFCEEHQMLFCPACGTRCDDCRDDMRLCEPVSDEWMEEL